MNDFDPNGHPALIKTYGPEAMIFGKMQKTVETRLVFPTELEDRVDWVIDQLDQRNGDDVIFGAEIFTLACMMNSPYHTFGEIDWQVQLAIQLLVDHDLKTKKEL